MRPGALSSGGHSASDHPARGNRPDAGSPHTGRPPCLLGKTIFLDSSCTLGILEILELNVQSRWTERLISLPGMVKVQGKHDLRVKLCNRHAMCMVAGDVSGHTGDISVGRSIMALCKVQSV